MARTVYLLAILVIHLAMIVAGVVDLYLHLDGRQTITAWIRQHPLAWWVPVGITLAVVAVLSWHLFAGAPRR